MRQRVTLADHVAACSAVLSLALVVLACQVCGAQGTVFGYAADRQVLKVCVLQIPDPAAPGTFYPVANPGVFIVLDQLPQKPGDWQLDNPLAPAGAVRDDPAYWLVPLNPGSAERLTEFDLVLINNAVPTDFATPFFPTHAPKQSANDLLRKIADNGVTLWFDGGAGMTTAPPPARAVLDPVQLRRRTRVHEGYRGPPPPARDHAVCARDQPGWLPGLRRLGRCGGRRLRARPADGGD
jgi:hypothetical protein